MNATAEPVAAAPIINPDPMPVSLGVSREREMAPVAPITHSEPEPILSPEEAEVGVTVQNQHLPNLSQVQGTGVVHSGETIVPPLEPSAGVKLPMTDMEQVVALKGDKQDSRYGFAMVIQRVRKALGI